LTTIVFLIDKFHVMQLKMQPFPLTTATFAARYAKNSIINLILQLPSTVIKCHIRLVGRNDTAESCSIDAHRNRRP